MSPGWRRKRKSERGLRPSLSVRLQLASSSVKARRKLQGYKMPTAADSSEEEDLPSLAELLARKRATKSSQGGVGQQEKVLSASATPSKVTAARTTARNDDSAQDGPHSTPPRRSPRRPSSTAIDGVQPTAGVLRHPLPSTAPKTVNQRSLAEELFPSSPPPPLVTRHNLYNYREPSPSVISDSEPDLPSPVRRRTGQQSASEEGSATEVRRKASRDSFYVEDSEDERVRTASGSASATKCVRFIGEEVELTSLLQQLGAGRRTTSTQSTSREGEGVTCRL